MPRTGRRRSLTIAAALLAVLAAPAAAQAATYSVTGNAADGPCNAPADLTCGGLADAATAASPNDIFNVAPGSAPYGSATFTVAGVTITGAPSFVVNGTLTFSGTGGNASKLQKAAVSQANGVATGVVVSGTSGLEISDSVIISGSGDGVQFHEGLTNKIVRSVVATGGIETVAVRVLSADLSMNDKALTMESTLVTGGFAGLSVNTGQGNGAISAAGDVDVKLRHVTSAGSTNGLRLDASKANPLIATNSVGNITADVTDSIIQNGVSKANYAGVLGVLVITSPPNTVTATYTRTLGVAADGATLAFDANTVFARPDRNNFRLRPGSPAINAGGFTAGESTTDLDGQDRAAAPTDQGADEFVNEAPKAVIEVKTNPQRSMRPVLFDASKSSDRETGAGGGIARYHWEFGDGQAADTTTPTTTHTYAGEGDTTATLTVIDAQGLSSAVASAPIKLLDGVPPAIVITKPTANQRIRLTTKKTTTKTVTVNGEQVKRKTTTTKKAKISFAGTAKDKSGVRGVVMTIERISKTASTRQAAAPAKRCNWLDPSKGIVLRSCSKPVLILAKLAKDGSWSYALKSTLKLSPGVYRIIVAGQDGAGATGNSAAVKDAIHRFTLVK